MFILVNTKIGFTPKIMKNLKLPDCCLGLPTADQGKSKNRVKFEERNSECSLYVYYDLYGCMPKMMYSADIRQQRVIYKLDLQTRKQKKKVKTFVK